MSRYVSAYQIVRALGGRMHGRHGSCKCPAHDDHNPSMSVSETGDGRVLVRCFSGCSQHAVIDALRARGLWQGEASESASYPGRLISPDDGMRDKSERARRQRAQDLWDLRRPAGGTVVEKYLLSRGVRVPVPDELGFIPELKHSESRQSYPAMVARLTDRDGFTAVQRTWLERDGSSKAPVKPAKKTLGPMKGGAVRLMSCRETLGLAEGIETALSAAQLYSLPVWATLSAHRLGAVDIPDGIESLVIFADAGDVGRDKAFGAADHYEGKGLTVEVILPDADFRGRGAGDFNDVLKEVGHS